MTTNANMLVIILSFGVTVVAENEEGNPLIFLLYTWLQQGIELIRM